MRIESRDRRRKTGDESLFIAKTFHVHDKPCWLIGLFCRLERNEYQRAIGVPFITAWASVVSAAKIQPGETILIFGAAGAVGLAAAQIANWKEARGIGAGTTSDPIPG